MPDEAALSEPAESAVDQLIDTITRFARSTKTADKVYLTALSIVNTLHEKNAKYKDVWSFWGIYGVIQEIVKKNSRLLGMTWNGETKDWLMSAEDILRDVSEEGCVYDTIRDIAGYSLLALTLFDVARAGQLEKALAALETLLKEEA